MGDRRLIKRIETRLENIAYLVQRGHIPRAKYEECRKKPEAELAEAKAHAPVPTVRQFSARLTDIVATWRDATADERARLVSSILSEI